MNDRKVKIDGEFYILPEGVTVEDVLAMIQDETDTHDCRADMNANGICQTCGYVNPETAAD